MDSQHKRAFFDVDYTLYDGFNTHNFYLYLANKKYASKSVYEIHKNNFDLYQTGKITYEEISRRVIQITADIVKGKKVDEVQALAHAYFSENNRLYPWF